MATITTRLGPADHGRQMSLDEFREAEEQDGFRYELARGVLEVTEVPDDPHGVVVSNLYDIISPYRSTHPGLIYRYGGGSEFRLWLPGMVTGRNPDLGVVLSGTPKDARGRRPPALVAEVVSSRSTDRDYVAKREEYLAFGVQEYWIVDPSERRITHLSRLGDVWMELTRSGNEPFASTLLPELEGRVSDLWVGLESE